MASSSSNPAAAFAHRRAEWKRSLGGGEWKQRLRMACAERVRRGRESLILRSRERPGRSPDRALLEQMVAGTARSAGAPPPRADMGLGLGLSPDGRPPLRSAVGGVTGAAVDGAEPLDPPAVGRAADTAGVLAVPSPPGLPAPQPARLPPPLHSTAGLPPASALPTAGAAAGAGGAHFGGVSEADIADAVAHAEAEDDADWLAEVDPEEVEAELRTITEELYAEMLANLAEEEAHPDDSQLDAELALYEEDAFVEESAMGGVPVETSSIMCPLCQSRWLFQTESRVFCRCGKFDLPRTTTVCLDSLEQGLSTAFQRHMAACTMKPAFTLADNVLRVDCKACGSTAPVLCAW